MGVIASVVWAAVLGAQGGEGNLVLPVRGDAGPDVLYQCPELSSWHQELPNARFVDLNSTLTYLFNTDGLTRLRFTLQLGNNFQVQCSTNGRRWTEVLNGTRIYGRDRHDGEVNAHTVDVSRMLPAEKLYLRFRDASRDDGWGAFLTEIAIESDAAAGHNWRVTPESLPGVIADWMV